MIRKIVSAFIALLCATTLYAQNPSLATQRNDLPSCRALLFHEDPRDTAHRDYSIIVDRTLTLTDKLLSDTVERALRALKPGDHLEILSFSGLTDSEFTAVQFDGLFDTPPTESELETKIPAAQIEKTQRCFHNQLELGRKKAREVLVSLLKAPLSDARRSEILKAMTTISQQVFKDPRAREKLALIVSDMLEYSDVASFYSNHELRLIDANKTMDIAKANQLVGNFSGAKVYVAGAAATSATSGGRGIRERQALHNFWLLWLERSNALLVEWGEPALLHDIG